MRSTSYQPSSDRRRALLGRRTTAFLLALAVDILVVIALLMLAPAPPPPPRPEPKPVAFQMLPEPQNTPTPAPRSQTVAKVKRASGGTPPPSPTPPAIPTAPTAPPDWMVTKQEFDATDIASIPSHPVDNDAGGGDAQGTGAGKDSGSAYGPGEGPGGERLYNAEWYREPTRAEMVTYLPAGVREGWGLIACKTIEDYHVENCRALGESPVGSGLARALRLASWQFRVRPPRIGGRPVIGAWVRIRFDIVTGVAK